MKFKELQPQFLMLGKDGNNPHADSINSDGVRFLCPKCFIENGGAVGTHCIVTWVPRIPVTPDLIGPGRWEMSGTGVDDVSFSAKPTSSIQLEGGCKAHFSITKGEITIHV